MFVQTVGIFSVAAVGRAAARLHVNHALYKDLALTLEEMFPELHRASTHFDVVGLLQNAIAPHPVFFKLYYKILQ